MSTAITPEVVTALPSHLNAGISPLVDGLTIRQAKFVERFIETQNATESIVYAYGVSDRNSAAVRGSRMLRLGKVQQAIQQRLGIAIASSDEVLQRLTIHARGDLTDVLESDGSFNLRKARKSGKSQLLKKLKVKRRYEKDADGVAQPVDEYEYEIHDPQAALEKLGRFHKLFTDRVETESTMQPDQLVTVFAAAFDRLRQQRLAEQAALNPAPNPPTE